MPIGLPIPTRRPKGSVLSKVVDENTISDSIYVPDVKTLMTSLIATPTGDGTLDVLAEGSSDCVTWYPIKAFPQVTTSAVHVFEVLKRNFHENVRWRLTVGGASPQFTTTVWAVPKSNEQEPRPYISTPVFG